MASARPLTFAELLRRYRRAAHLSQETLAELAGLSRRAVSDLERTPQRVPRQDTAELLAEALGLAAQERARFLAVAARRYRVQGTLAVPGSARPNPTTPLHQAILTPLVGRGEELARLERQLQGTEPPVLLLAGEPGIGKTRLLREAAERAHKEGWTVLEGGCHRGDAQGPYAPLLGALAHHLAGQSPSQLQINLQGCAWLVRLLPELQETAVVPLDTWSLPPDQARRLLFAAVARFLRNVAGPSGTLLVLDDLQWAGQDALNVLASLMREPLVPPMRVLGAYRTTDVHPGDDLSALLVDLLREGLLAQTRIQPLEGPEAAELLGMALRGREDAAVVERVLQRCGGVPFFLLSCARALHVGALADARADVPWDAAASIRQRVAALPAGARHLLGVAAVIGRTASQALLGAVLARPEDEVLTLAEANCAAGLLLESGSEAYEFAHDLIREVVEGDLSAGRRRLLHRRIAEALEGRPETDGTQGTEGIQEKGRNGQRRRAAEVAYHFLEADERARALPHVLLAGEQAEALYAHAEAEHHYRTAATLAHELGDHAREAEALEQLASTVLLLGHQAEALALAERAIQRYQSLGDREGEFRVLGRSLELLGPAALARAQSRADSVGEADGVPAASPGLATLYNGLAQVYFTGSRFPASWAAATRAEQVARAAHDDAALVQALHWRIEGAGALGEDRLQAQLDLIPLAERVGDLWVLMFTLVDIALIYLHDHGDFARAKSYLERALDAAERRGSIWGIVFTLAAWVEYHYFAGEWEQGRAIAVRAVAIMRQTERAGTHTALIALGLLDLVEGRGQDAEHQLGQGLALAASEGDLAALRWGGRLLAERDLVAGDAAAALARLEPLLDRPGLQEWDVAPLLPLVAWAQLALDKDEAAAATLAASKARCGRLWLVDALRMEAMLARKPGRWGEAEAALEETLTLCRAMPYPYAETKALYVFGQVHAAKGEPGRAREKYEQALAICARLGEGLYRRQIEQALGDLNAD